MICRDYDNVRILLGQLEEVLLLRLEGNGSSSCVPFRPAVVCNREVPDVLGLSEEGLDSAPSPRPALGLPGRLLPVLLGHVRPDSWLRPRKAQALAVDIADGAHECRVAPQSWNGCAGLMRQLDLARQPEVICREEVELRSQLRTLQ
ncbi:hypothetical protein VC83_09347 [Pseudogymnoascus destructans]|uniref:Uncharacterized protein n=1 Tax=Pseudogymnoascus destructans TaxID=655981 RepID=A0A176ZWX7_9PEZI|nr:uncharacterized protein VC83_09347 [Pseudogymnoascus destructans]OAF54287.1 hypothetical protein VC83_09347 [Pseudogymnoascus destructans]